MGVYEGVVLTPALLPPGQGLKSHSSSSPCKSKHRGVRPPLTVKTPQDNL